MISSITASASVSARCSPSMSLPIASRIITHLLLEIGEEVLQQLLSVLRQDTLGVELDPERRPVPVAQGHHFTLRRERRHGQALRQRLLNDQAVIAGRLEWARDFTKQAFAGVIDLAGLAVHQPLCPGYEPAEKLAQTLMSQADAQ